MNNQNISVSVTVPLYKNDKRTLLCIASAITQGSIVSEIILSDDGSNQELGELAQKLDPRVRYFQNKPSLGMYKNYVNLYKLVNNRYFLWLGDDDYISPALNKSVLNSIDNHPDCVAWHGIPNYHSTNVGTLLSGKILTQNITKDPYKRVLDIFAQGKYGVSFYAVTDKKQVSIKPLEKLLDWPYEQYSFDYVWMVHLAIQGPLYQSPELLYFYDQSHWGGGGKEIESKTMDEKMRKFYRNINTTMNPLNVPLIYFCGVLISMYCYLEKNKNNFANKKDLAKSWRKIFTMLFTKYLYARLSKSHASIILSMTLYESLIFCSKTLDANYNSSNKAYSFVKNTLDEASKYEIVEELLHKKSLSYLSINWRYFPDGPLKFRSIKNLIKTTLTGKSNFAIWSK